MFMTVTWSINPYHFSHLTLKIKKNVNLKMRKRREPALGERSPLLTKRMQLLPLT